MKLKRTQYLTIHSKKRANGTNSMYTVVVPDGCIEADAMSERLRLSVVSLQVRHSWYQIVQGKNVITRQNVETNEVLTRTIPPGTYPYCRLSRVIGELFPGMTVRYSEPTAEMRFSTVGVHRWTFSDGIAQVLGFVPGVVYEGTVVSSPQLCRPLVTDSLHLKITNLPPMDEAVNYTNVGGVVTSDDTLAIVPVTDTRPFSVLNWTNNTDVGMFTADNKLNILGILVTDDDDNEMVWVPDHVFVLKVETWMLDEDQESNELLRQMKDELKDLSMMQAMGPGGALGAYRIPPPPPLPMREAQDREWDDNDLWYDLP